ncbi:glycosyltransferase [Actinomyces sp. MRS3W]|uniref:glycosyltransferase n=1 Tax=Actinomyces sp. MRS3W TaxID=2800796 RepID=UPI0028FD7826|nr:glycosyltransferase [Actinomyces sp. MRS3W]MDU0347531.1 glycosyltransferase [Actinomyces sp. MRS3W]
MSTVTPSVMSTTSASPRVAIAHDYLTQRGGAERVVLAMHRAFPDAPIYTTLYEPAGTFPEFADADIRVSPLNHLAPLRRDHRIALPLLAPAATAMRVDADIMVASSTGWAHGFRTTGRSLVYCHSPARFLHLRDQYLGTAPRVSVRALGLAALRPALLRWDRRAARRADCYLANSTIVAERIARVYGIDAKVLFPPGGLDAAAAQDPIDEVAAWAGPGWPGFHLVVSRLMPYKNVDVVLEAFRRMPQERVLVIGRGPEAERLAAMAPDNARLLAGLSDAQMRWAYAHATALLAPSFEDFGLTPLEAYAFGTPVLALRGGGYLDTVKEGTTGLFLEEATPAAVVDAVERAGNRHWEAEAIRAHGAGFSEERFATALHAEVAALAAPTPGHKAGGRR